LDLTGSSPQRALTTVEVTGPLTRDEAARWREALADGLARGRGLRIDLASSGPCDLAGVQLLLAAIESGKLAGAPVVLASIPGVLTAVARRAGLLDRLAAMAGD
jgi:ABC-type transporter Mla MlaB component